MTDQIKERIRFNTELLKLISIFLLAIGGGVIALILGEVDSGREIVFIAGGITAIFACVVSAYSTVTRTRKLLEER